MKQDFMSMDNSHSLLGVRQQLEEKEKREPLVSVVIPCLNEEETIGICIQKIQEVFTNEKIDGEVIVCDNGSTDNSVRIAESMGVCVVHQPIRGYGNAYLKGFAGAGGLYLIMIDADDTYDFNLIPEFLKKLVSEGYDFVTGSRYLRGFGNNIRFSSRYLGNPIITTVVNLLFGTNYTDVYCGLRGFSRRVYNLIHPVSPGMEFNIELAINVKLAGLRITEIPVELKLRKGKSKLFFIRDGWRSLRLLLLYCPNKIFLWPGFFFLTSGIFIHLLVLSGLIKYEGQPLDVIISALATVLSVVGFEILSLGLHAKTYSWSNRFDRNNPILLKFYKWFKLEMGLILGTTMVLLGIAILVYRMIDWLKSRLILLSRPEWILFSATLIIIGFGIIFSSLFISAMSMERK